MKPVAPVAKVDLPRFMGDWYVIASIPTFIEKEAYNAIESYKLSPDGSIDTTFTFNKGGLDGPAKRYNPHGFVVENTDNAVWGMQFVWPVKSEYIIAYLDDDYSTTVIARNARDYVWIMARSPVMSDARYAELTGMVAGMGYDVSKLRKVPHKTGQR
ncbi:MAG: lipocalin family protein [Pseudomonadota bacterium]